MALPIDSPKVQREQIENVAREVGRAIARCEKRLVSGFGLTVGSATLAGALGEVLQQSTPNLDKSLLLRPFPQEAPPGIPMEEFRTRYREGMISLASICIFIGGLKKVGGKIVLADGVLEEAKVAKTANRVRVPIGFTGGAAAELWKEMRRDGVKPTGLSTKDFELLNKPSTSHAKVAQLIEKVISAVDKS